MSANDIRHATIYDVDLQSTVTYKMKRWQVRLFGCVMFPIGTAMIVLFLPALVALWMIGQPLDGPSGVVAVIALGGLFFGLLIASGGAAMMLARRGGRIILTPTEFRQEEWFGGVTAIPWSEVRAIWMGNGNFATYLELTSGRQHEIQEWYFASDRLGFSTQVVARIAANGGGGSQAKAEPGPL